ncbi:CHAT domain-containing protein [Nostoc sp. CHAB 5844]|nr:CHAT domain-containing protein [Nostoc sp. CHAB 5844]
MSSFSTAPPTILFITANPKATVRLRLDQELRDIAEGLKRSQKRDQFNLEQRLAVRPRDIQRAMLDIEPQIIHFSGHGGGEEGLVFEDDAGNVKLVDGSVLAGLFELFADKIACVVLNGCYSEVQARAIADHIPYVIGMNQAIGDQAAIAFAVGFYDALGAGRDIEFAYKLGCAAIRLEGIAEHLTPVLLKQSTKAATLTATPKSKLSHRQRQDLEAEQTGLQRRYNLLSQKIQRLGEALDIEIDPATCFKLEIQLQQAQSDRDQISREMADVDSKLEK